jgi:methylglutaconyl-CoA hydratase
MTKPVLVEMGEADAIAVLTLNRPEKRNALNPETVRALKEALERIEGDERVRVVLLEGAGRDFCAGADLAHIEAMFDASHEEHHADASALGELFVRMRLFARPIVAAVQGNALAGGAGLATACDMVLASDDAWLGYPEVHIGFVPAIVMTMLIRSVGEKTAFELVATGKRIDAGEAHRIGLVNAVFSRHTFAADARAFAVELASRSTTAIGLTKRLLYELGDLGFEEGIARGARVNAEARMTEDCRAGVRAFLKRHGS